MCERDRDRERKNERERCESWWIFSLILLLDHQIKKMLFATLDANLHCHVKYVKEVPIFFSNTLHSSSLVHWTTPLSLSPPLSFYVYFFSLSLSSIVDFSTLCWNMVAKNHESLNCASHMHTLKIYKAWNFTHWLVSFF